MVAWYILPTWMVNIPTKWALPATKGSYNNPYNWTRNKWVCLGLFHLYKWRDMGPNLKTGSWANSSPNFTKELDEKHESYTQPTWKHGRSHARLIVKKWESAWKFVWNAMVRRTLHVIKRAIPKKPRFWRIGFGGFFLAKYQSVDTYVTCSVV